MIAVLHAPQPAVVSSWSAADHWGLPGWRRHEVDVTTSGRTGFRDQDTTIVVHQPRLVLARHITEHDRVPITSPTRTIFDLAGRRDVHPLRLERALDTAMSRGLVSSESLTAMLADLAEKGRPGIKLLRELIAARSVRGYRPPESGLESRLRQLASQAGLPDFVRQVNVGSETAWVGRVDFRHPVLPLLVEVDSATHHGSLTDQEHDQRRRAELVAAGWHVVSVTGSDLFHQPDAVIARLRRAIHGVRRVAGTTVLARNGVVRVHR